MTQLPAYRRQIERLPIPALKDLLQVYGFTATQRDQVRAVEGRNSRHVAELESDCARIEVDVIRLLTNVVMPLVLTRARHWVDATTGGSHLPRFYFRTTDQEGFSAEDRAFEFADEQAAINEAKVTLAEMAADGLPQDPISLISIQVLDEEHVLVVELRLVLEMLPNTARGIRADR